ncbi:type 2 isopentenyl-diphosphate Delta-isomerase [Methanosarcinaceae archaeon]|nr:type 2 isopentenyl-diphosphate Delta-isomerase [Methanosarcinaceae archaeon]MBQ3620346.1 type 2 isopentenyl-diphosphate Delta-isomerase [Methanosarcinaceae archaeon]
MENITSRRKIEHLELCAGSHVEARTAGPGFEDITLVHRALPEINMDDIDMSTVLFGKKLSYPFLIASITGGHPETTPVNAALAEAAEELNIGIGVGSQRAAIDDRNQRDSFEIVRQKAPTTLVYANIGAAQIKEYGIGKVEELVEMIDADALAIHLNFLQEAIQPEGDRDARNCLEIISEIAKSLNVPVFVKETGAGISREDALLLKKAGIAGIDVGGLGGTSWAGVEVYRARDSGNSLCEHLGELFWDFGIPTAASIVECKVSVPVIATGGIRNGLDIAKSIALGASAASAALPFVRPAFNGKDAVVSVIGTMMQELRTAMFLTGCGSVGELSRAPITIGGRTLEYLTQRGFNIKDYSVKDML